MRPKVAELAQCRGVEGAGLDAAGAEAAQAGAHLAGRAGGEGDREHLGRRVDTGRDAVRDAVRDRAGLARAGTGEHAHRTAQCLRDEALLRVEGSQQVGQGTTPARWWFGWLRITLDGGGDSP